METRLRVGVGQSPVGPPLMSHYALSPSPDSAEGPWAPKGRNSCVCDWTIGS